MFETLSKKDKLQKAKKQFLDAVAQDSDWQGDAKKAFNFRDGLGQWTKEEMQIMEEEMRPALTFNMTKSSIDLIMGMNEDNKIRYRVSPTEPSDAFLAEVLNDIADWVYETYEFEDEENDALESATISGRGYCAIDVVPDPKRFGEIIMEVINIPVHEVHFDPAARRRTLNDASAIYWDRWLPVEEFKMRYPNVKGKTLKEIVEFARSWGLEGTDESGMTPVDPFDIPMDVDSDDSDYDAPLDLSYYDKSKQMVRVIHMEYWEVFDRYYVWDPVNKDWTETPDKPNKEMMDAYEAEFGEMMAVETVKDKKVKWLHFTGDHILYDDDSPLPYDGFSIVPMFAFTDVSRRTMNHFGIVRGMIDPQKEINKRWSQALNMLNNQVQPGVFAEVDAFVNELQAKQSMKEAGGITYLNAGALTSGKIQERNLPTFPNAPMQMEQYSQDIMRKITGINPDLLGQDRGRQEPGVVIRLRQQQGITLLKPLFRNFNLMKKGIFQRLLAIVTEYMPDEQITRILGENDRYVIDPNSGVIQDQKTGNVAELRNIRDLAYNVKSEESPGNMSKRMMELQALLEMGQSGVIPVDPIQIIEKMELPETEKARWIEYINQTQQAQAQAQEEQMQMQMQLEQSKIGVQSEKNVLDFILGSAKIDQMEAKDDKKMAIDVARMDQEKRMKLAEFAIELITALNQAKQQQGVEELKTAQQALKNEGMKIKNAGDSAKLVQQGMSMANDALKIEQTQAGLVADLAKIEAEHAKDQADIVHQRELQKLEKEQKKTDIEYQKEKTKLDIKKAKETAKAQGEKKDGNNSQK